MNGLERLRTLIAGQDDQPLNAVVNYLLTQEQYEEQYRNLEKNLKQMIDYIKDKSREFQVNGVAMIDDNTVFEWAVTYWTTSNEELGLNKKPVIPKIVPKTTKVDTGLVREQLKLEL